MKINRTALKGIIAAFAACTLSVTLLSGCSSTSASNASGSEAEQPTKARTNVERLQEQYEDENAAEMASAPFVSIGEYDYDTTKGNFPVWGSLVNRFLDQEKILDLNSGALYIMSIEQCGAVMVPFLDSDGNQCFMEGDQLAKWREAAQADGIWQENPAAKEIAQ